MINVIKISYPIAQLVPNNYTVAMVDYVPESSPIIDFSNDDDVKQPGCMGDAVLILKGWGDAKVAGESLAY